MSRLAIAIATAFLFVSAWGCTSDVTPPAAETPNLLSEIDAATGDSSCCSEGVEACCEGKTGCTEGKTECAAEKTECCEGKTCTAGECTGATEEVSAEVSDAAEALTE